jgi:hypothetical protein
MAAPKTIDQTFVGPKRFDTPKTYVGAKRFDAPKTCRSGCCTRIAIKQLNPFPHPFLCPREVWVLAVCCCRRVRGVLLPPRAAVAASVPLRHAGVALAWLMATRCKLPRWRDVCGAMLVNSRPPIAPGMTAKHATSACRALGASCAAIAGLRSWCAGV